MPTAIVTGANSGIGWAFAKKLVDEGYTVHACDLIIGPKMKELKTDHLHQLDVTSESSIKALAKTFGNQPLDLLLNIAGVMSPKDQDALESVSLSVLEKTFQVNTFGPLLLTQALLPALSQSKQPKIGNMSSRVGSIEDNSSGGSYAYRASKAALNSISKSMAVDLKGKGIPVVILHPGIVKSGLLPMSKEGDQPEMAVEGLWSVLQSKGLEETGTFWHRNGEELPW